MNILKKAQKARYKTRQVAYGDAVKNYRRIAKIASHICCKQVTPQDCINIMIATKLVREDNNHNPDNLIDIAGYADILNRIEESYE